MVTLAMAMMMLITATAIHCKLSNMMIMTLNFMVMTMVASAMAITMLVNAMVLTAPNALAWLRKKHATMTTIIIKTCMYTKIWMAIVLRPC